MVRDEIAVSGLIGECVESKRPLADAFGIALQAEIGEGRASLRGDRRLLKAALCNLIDIALKHARYAGTVTIGHKATGERDTITIACDGEGIPFDELCEMQDISCRPARSSGWEPPECDTRHAGLSIARDVVDLHSGRIGVRSLEGKGAAFSIHLPRYCLQPA
jgi:signal transduction histidine kinase